MSNLDLEPAIQAAVRSLLPELREVVADAAARAVETTMADRLVTLKEAAELAGTTYGAIKMRVARGHLPVVRDGAGRPRVRRSEVLKQSKADDTDTRSGGEGGAAKTTAPALRRQSGRAPSHEV